MKSILVLEYESLEMGLLRDMLKEFKLIEAADAEQALCLFSQHGRHLDLLLADVTVPKSTGIQIALLFRSEIPNLPVILTSDSPVSDWTGRDYTDLERLGSSSVALLSKPVQGEILLKAIRDLLGLVHIELARTA